jgi:cytosine/adenosine deaminase-related metal-dependent hydrolase
MAREVDIVVEVGALLPLSSDEVVYDALVAVDDGRIVYAGAKAGAEEFSAAEIIRNPDGVVMPGFVDTHTHVGAHFWGTLCDDENIITALYELWFPMEAAYDPELSYVACLLGYWDAVKAGVTTLGNDEYFPEATAQAAATIGIRSLVANRINEFALDAPPRYNRAERRFELDYVREKAQTSLTENVEFIEKWQGHSLVVPCLGPHAPDLLSTDMLLACAEAAETYDVKMLIHVAQSEAEVERVREKGHKGSIHYLQEIGFLSPRVQAAHMVWLDEEEIDIAASSGMGMSWTPTIMMACQSYAKIDKLMKSGIKMGFGTDCFSMDVVEELRYALYSANYVIKANGFRLTAYDLIRRATIGGAECLGLDDQIGTIETGKKADLIVINMRDAQLLPNTNYFENIAYRGKSRNVTHTIIDGRIVHANEELKLVNQDEIFDEAREASRVWVGRSKGVLEETGVVGRIQPHFFKDGYGDSFTSSLRANLVGSR